MKPLFIVNPMSGGGRTRQRLPALRAAITRLGLDADMLLTEAPGHGRALAADALRSGRETLVACGGDGTLNEVASAILDAAAGDSVRLGTVGLGTGRDVARCLGMFRPAVALKAIAAGFEQRIDAGRVRAVGSRGEPVTHYFLVEAAAGWVPEVSHAVPRRLKRLGDTVPYVATALARMGGNMAREFGLTIDGIAYSGRYNTISLHNVEYWGGALLAAPGASPADGQLDVIRWGDTGRMNVIRALQGQQRGGTHLPGVDRHLASALTISSPKRTRIDVDGEHGGWLPAEIDVLPGALRFLVPPI